MLDCQPPLYWSHRTERRLTMREGKQSEATAFGGKEVFVGIDVHKESGQVTVRTEGE